MSLDLDHHCGGFWFRLSSGPMRYYRCLRDGTILAGALAPSGKNCPHCGRPVRSWWNGLTLELEHRTVRQVRVPPDLGGGWVDLPE